jgi:hypothetical protein
MHTVTIEILRPGKSHSQELSEQTVYIALCGSHPAADLTIGCNQAKFSKYKQMLRYDLPDEQARHEGISFFEQLISMILDDIEFLRTEGQTDDFLHLRLVMTPKELAQLPFELALTPKGFPGQHSKPFLLNPQRLTTLTRETRQVAPTRYLWPYKPRVLFAWAEPKGEVPHDAHYVALRDLLKHFARPMKDNAEPVPDILPILTPLKNASLRSINAAVKAAIDEGNPYTHIHILAHGSKSDRAAGEVFKLLLHHNDDVNQSHLTDGSEMASAILEIDGNRTNFPAVVSLTACDSSNEGSVSLPAGSLAHQLHESGIPCVFASQFPISVAGSVYLVSTLYKNLLIEGDDPRKALYNTRKSLYDNSNVHDWASLVAYVRFPEDIDEQLKDNRLKILLESLKTSNAWADHILKHRKDIDPGKVKDEFDSITSRLDKSIKDLTDLFKEGTKKDEKRFAEHFGLLGSAFKRKAEHIFRMAALEPGRAESLYEESKEALKTSREWYFNGYDKQKNHWTAIQYLSLTAVIKGSLEEPADQAIWTITRIFAEDDVKEDKEPMDQIWGCGTLAELYLLFPLTLSSDRPDRENEIATAKQKAKQYLDKINKAKFTFADRPDLKQGDIAFALESTKKQFERYVIWWPVMMPSKSTNLLREIATDLMDSL